MALFEKKSKVEKALELFNSLTDEELEEFLSKADLNGDGNVDNNDTEPENNTNEQAEEADSSTDTETDNGQTEQNEAETGVTEQESTESNTESQETESQVNEAEDESQAETENAEENGTDKYDALKAEIDNLKEVIAGLTARLDADKENETDNKEEFGLEMKEAGKEADGKSDLEKAKDKYWAF